MKSTKTEINVHQPPSSRSLGRRWDITKRGISILEQKNYTFTLCNVPGAYVASLIARTPSLMSSSHLPPLDPNFGKYRVTH